MRAVYAITIGILGLFALPTHAMAIAPPPPQPKPAIKVKGKRIHLAVRPTFHRRKAILKKTCHEQLRLLGRYLRKRKTLFIRIEVHSNSRGSSRYNKRMTQKRANAIKKFLGAEGIIPSRIKAIGYGESRPIDTNRTRAGRRRNARVEFHIAAKPKKK